MAVKSFIGLAPGPNVIKLFCPYFRDFHYKLECLSLASFSSLVLCFQIGSKPTSEASFRCCTLGQAPSFTHKHQTRLEMFVRDKCSSLLQKFVDYSRKKFYRIDKHSSLLRKSVNYRQNKFYRLAPGLWSLAERSN